MSAIGYTWWLATQVLQLLLTWWPVMLTLVLATILASRYESTPSSDQLKSLPGLLWLFPVLVLLWAGVAGPDQTRTGWSGARIAVLVSVLVMQLGSSLALVYVARGRRLSTAGFCTILAWISGLCVYAGVLSVAAGPPAD
jgi:hypothetical protein